MELNGPGADIKKESKTRASGKESPKKGDGREKLPDPISNSINERKAEGSFLSVNKSAKAP